MDYKTQAMFKTLDRVQKATKGISTEYLQDAEFQSEAVRYKITVTDHLALRSMIKRLPGLFTVYLNGTDGWSIDVTRKALLDLLYCDESECGMGLSYDGQVAHLVIFQSQTQIEFSRR